MGVTGGILIAINRIITITSAKIRAAAVAHFTASSVIDDVNGILIITAEGIIEHDTCTAPEKHAPKNSAVGRQCILVYFERVG